MYLFRIPQTIARIIPECWDAIYDCLQAKYLKEVLIYNFLLFLDHFFNGNFFSSRENADGSECIFFFTSSTLRQQILDISWKCWFLFLESLYTSIQ
nr:unnamed protein product [Callosobruchus analis]